MVSRTFVSRCKTFCVKVNTAHRGITPFNLLRLGVTWGEGKRACLGGIFQRDWGTLPTREIEGIYQRLLRLMEDKPFGIFDTVMMIVGDEEAQRIGDDSGIVCRPRPTLKRRRNEVESESEGQMELV
jgi:hypothetical protein